MLVLYGQLEKVKKEEGRAETEENEMRCSKKQHQKECFPDSISSSGLPQTGEAWWMALATRNNPSLNNSSRG